MAKSRNASHRIARKGGDGGATPIMSPFGKALDSWYDAARLGLEASAVVGFRMAKVGAANPFTKPIEASLAALEVNRMVTEKALTVFQVAARAGQADPLAPMRDQVAANRKRLERY